MDSFFCQSIIKIKPVLVILFLFYHLFYFWISYCLKLPLLLFKWIIINYKNQWGKVIRIKCFWCYHHRFRMIIFHPNRSEYSLKILFIYQIDCIAITTSFPFTKPSQAIFFAWYPLLSYILWLKYNKFTEWKYIFLDMTWLFHQSIIKTKSVLMIL